MFGGLDILTVSTLFALTGAPAIKCQLPDAPKISVRPTTKEIQYDFSLTTTQLSAMKSASRNPYGPSVDTSTGGLREDQPIMRINVKMGMAEYKHLAQFCVWYDDVDVEIYLQPKIYIAKELNYSPCREGVLGHEHKHVNVDREVMNKYARIIGQALEKTVNEAGALGPYRSRDMKPVEDQMMSRIQGVIDRIEPYLKNEMKAKQSVVDSLSEYERVNKICHDGTR